MYPCHIFFKLLLTIYLNAEERGKKRIYNVERMKERLTQKRNREGKEGRKIEGSLRSMSKYKLLRRFIVISVRPQKQGEWLGDFNFQENVS